MWIAIIIIALIIYFRNKGVPIFLYHQVNEISSVTPDLFEEHLKILKERNMNTLTLKEYGDGNIKSNSVLISLDDGYYDNYSKVFPLLKKYNMKATVFLNTMYIKNRRVPIYLKICAVLLSLHENFLIVPYRCFFFWREKL